jgi:hypothetical protein
MPERDDDQTTLSVHLLAAALICLRFVKRWSC